MLKMDGKKGMLIVFEGVDHCGKSTQIKLLHEALIKNGCKSTIMTFPDRTTKIGKMINEHLKNINDLATDYQIPQVMHLLFSANRWEKRNIIIELLNSGTTILMDRYFYSGIAFTAAKGVDLEWCSSTDKGLPQPDMIIYLYVKESDIEKITKRGDFGKEIYETTCFQKKVLSIYNQLHMQYKDIWCQVDALDKKDIIHNKIYDYVNSKLENS